MALGAAQCAMFTICALCISQQKLSMNFAVVAKNRCKDGSRSLMHCQMCQMQKILHPRSRQIVCRVWWFCQPVKVLLQILQIHLPFTNHIYSRLIIISLYIIYRTYHFSVPYLALPCTDQGVAAVNGHKEVQSKAQHEFGFNNDADEWQ